MKDQSKKEATRSWQNYSTASGRPSKTIALTNSSLSRWGAFDIWWSGKPLSRWKGKVLLALFTGIFVALFLNIFQPFTVNNQDGSWGFSLLIAGYGFLATLIIGFTEFAVRPMVKRYFGGEGATEWKGEAFWYAWHFLTVAMGMMLYRTYLCYGTVIWPPFSEVLTMIYRTFMVGSIPMILLILGKRLYRQQEMIQRWVAIDNSPKKLYLSGENRKEQLILYPSQLLFISSSDNYADIHFQQEGTVKKQILRSSLTRLQKQLTSHPHIVRCHRSYIVNLEQITFYEKKGKGLQLTLERSLEPIPVSHKHRGAILQLMPGSNIPV